MFRRTVATVVNEQASLNLASELLGHADPEVTIEHYIRRNEQANPLTAELLDQVYARDDDGSAIGLKCAAATLFGKRNQPADSGASEFPEHPDTLFK